MYMYVTLIFVVAVVALLFLFHRDMIVLRHKKFALVRILIIVIVG